MIFFSLLFSFSCSEAAACAQDSEEGLDQGPYTFFFWLYQIVFEYVFQISIYKAYRLKIYTPKIYIRIQIQIFFIRMFIKLCVQSLWCLYLYVYSIYTWLGIVDFFSLVEFSFSFQTYFELVCNQTRFGWPTWAWETGGGMFSVGGRGTWPDAP